ncbi:MAG TPA: helix-turn-helix domain-containing protein, partial [Homoserinimonas sp.]|nr:helix-turn-helix domain-containing protein [Homoserinimonas sp.]
MASALAAPAAVPKELRTVQSVSHAAGILKALHDLGKPSTLSELARRIHLSKPATYALLKTLELDGLVERDPTARYRLSWGLYELGSAVVRTVGLTQAARMHIDRLA